MAKKITIIINQDPYHFEKSELTPQDFRDAVGAPNEYEVWLINKRPDPEGQLPVDDIQITGPVEIKSGQHYRVVPPGTFGQTAAVNASLLDEVLGLRELGYNVEVIEADGVINLIFENYSLPLTYNKPSTILLIRLPISYPNGNPDMFWTETDVVCADGSMPKNADGVETYLEKQWRKFSWHPQNWNPAIGNLNMYLEFVDHGLIQAAKK